MVLKVNLVISMHLHVSLIALVTYVLSFVPRVGLVGLNLM